MPGILKFYMYFGFGWGIRALWAAASGWDVLAHQGDLDEFLTTQGGRVLLALGGAVAVTQAWLVLRPRPLGLYMFWAFHGWFLLAVGVMTRSPAAVCLTLIWPIVLGLYGWYRRAWFRFGAPRGRVVEA